MRESESGNVIFIIFIAIALFAGLSYAVTQGNRTGTDTMDRSAARIHINEMKAYGAQIQKAIARLKTMKGCTTEQISFEHPDYSSDYENTNAPTDERCHVFSQSGGKVPFLAPPLDARVAESMINNRDWNSDTLYIFLGNNAVLNKGSGDSDILLSVSFIKESVCAEANRNQDITAYTRSLAFNGYNHASTTSLTLGDTADDADLAGKDYGCALDDIRDGYHFFYVLEQR